MGKRKNKNKNKAQNQDQNQAQNQNVTKTSAIVARFEAYIGKAELADWQRLCEDIGLDGDFSSITKCRNAIEKVYVNIYDLLDAVAIGKKPRRFRNRKELADYSIGTKKIYPKKKAKQGPIKALLREIIYSPRHRGTCT